MLFFWQSLPIFLTQKNWNKNPLQQTLVKKYNKIEIGYLKLIFKCISSGAKYVIVHNKIGWRNVKTCLFGSAKRFWLSMIAQFAVASKWQRCAPAEKRVINMTWLLLSVSDWPIIMIRPGGLLLVVPDICRVPASVLWVGFQKGK